VRPALCGNLGAEQGTTRRNSDSIPTSRNEAQRRAGRALAVVAALTLRVTFKGRVISQQRKRLRATLSGQLLRLG
jgi:hypothetical protein